MTISTQAPHEAAGRIGKDMMHPQRVGVGIENPDVRLMGQLGVVGVGRIELAVVQEAAVEVLGALRRGGRQELPGGAVVGGHGGVGDRIEPGGISRGCLCGVGRGEPLHFGVARHGGQGRASLRRLARRCGLARCRHSWQGTKQTKPKQAKQKQAACQVHSGKTQTVRGGQFG